MEQARTVEHFKVKHNRITGLIYAIISSASFGMIPMFTVPAIKAGMDNSSIIFYRFAFSTLLFSLLILCKRPDMRIRKKAILPLLVLTLFYFFKERLSLKLIASVVLAISGVALLSLNGGGGAISMKGVAIVLVTVFCYGSYIVGVNKTKVKEMDSMAVTFYVLLLTTVFCIANIAISGHTLQAIPDMHIGLNLVMLGFIPTLVSNLCLVLAIKHIGSTTTSILGCMEPLTAVVIGVLFLGEQLVPMQYAGIAVVLISVLIVLTDKTSAK